MYSEHHTPPRGFFSANSSAQLQGLSCHDTRYTVTVQHAVGIHNPTHDNWIGSYIRCRYILLRTNDGSYRGSIAAGKSAKLMNTQSGRVHLDTAFSSAKGNVHYRGLKGHPGS